MISKIINMAERIKDEDDRLLESLFDSAPIADAGFSKALVRRIRRRLWIRRLTVPVAALIGGVFAIKPLADLVAIAANLSPVLSKMVPSQMIDAISSMLPQLPTIILGAMVLGVCLLGIRALED